MGGTKHTQGPWKWDGYGLYPENPDPDHHAVHTILEVENFAYGFVLSELAATSAEDQANRRLIAAAPDLLATLKTAIRVSQDLAEDDEYCEEWRAVMIEMRRVIAKAEGLQ